MIKRIRDVKRIPDLVKYGKEWHARSQYKHIPFDEEIARETARAAIIFSNQAVWTSEIDGKIRGLCIGMLCQYAFSKKKYATDLLYMADEEGPKLFYTLRDWASDKAEQLQLGITSGIGDPEAVGRFYELNGLRKVGGIYVLEY